MKYVSLVDEPVRELPFYLAMEEYVARCLDEDSAFFMWQVEPTVIFGRNQLIETEVNLEYCRNHGIHTYRRKSGGGCVYADMSNIMFSYVTKDENVRLTFDSYIKMVVEMLRSLGVDAGSSGRNDIMIAGKKVSGNAFYHTSGKSIVHGTMLYDTDMENMLNAITPSREKIESKGVESVRNHITTLSRYLEMDIEDFKKYAKRALCDGEIVLGSTARSAIEEIEKGYLNEGFIYGKNPRYTMQKKMRIENVGEIVVNIELKNGIIKDIDVKGDYFLVGDIDKDLISKMRGLRYEETSIRSALEGVKIQEIIYNFTIDQLIQLLF